MACCRRFDRPLLQQRLPHRFDARPADAACRQTMVKSPTVLERARHVDRGTPLSRHVRHVEDQHGRQSDVEHLADKKQIAFEVRGINDAGYRVEPTSA